MSPSDEPISSPGATPSRSKGPPPQALSRSKGRYNVLGVGVSELTLASACELVLASRNSRPLGYVCVTPVHAVSEACADASFRKILNASYLTTPDGMPLVWLAPPGVAEVLREKLTARFPGLEVAGTFTPPYRPLSPGELAELHADVAHTRPDVIWVGLGTPKQERFMAAHWSTLNAGLLIGVGAAFDFHSGRVRQAPRWMQRCGLEWFFRLCTEPRRLGPRYLKTNPLFLLRVLAQKTGLKKYPLG